MLPANKVPKWNATLLLPRSIQMRRHFHFFSLVFLPLPLALSLCCLLLAFLFRLLHLLFAVFCFCFCFFFFGFLRLALRCAGIVVVVSLGIISTDCVSFHFWLLFQLLLSLFVVVVVAFASAVIWYAFCRAFTHACWAVCLCLPAAPALPLLRLFVHAKKNYLRF